MLKILKIPVFTILLFTGSTIHSQAPTDLLLQPDKSIKIFDESISKKGLEIPYKNQHKYYLRANSCENYVFGREGQVIHEDRCPGDYVLRLPLGSYNYKAEDLIDIKIDSLGYNEFNLNRFFIDRIERKENTTGKFGLEVIDFNGHVLGEVNTVFYRKRPSIFTKIKSLTFLRNDLNQLIGKKIFLEKIVVYAKTKAETKVYYVYINQKIKIEAKTYRVFLRKHWGLVKKSKEKINLYYLDHTKQEYKKEDRLSYHSYH